MADEKKRMAGVQRWVGVPKSEQKALVSKAAHARWRKRDVLVAQHVGVVKLGGFEISCAVLNDGRRIISERGFCDALGHRRHPEEYARRRREIEAGQNPLPVYVVPVVRQFLSEDAIEKLSKPIRYQITEGFGIPAFGIDATLIADICEAYVAGREAGVLKAGDQLKAEAALRMIRALARVAIVALIDEATGYQVVRDRDELQRLLGKYVSEEHRPWTRVFPDEFYIELFRLRNLTIEDVRKRPQYFGHLTNDIVYDRLLPGLLPKLKEVNPANTRGRRSRTHTQHLTDSVGEVHLRTHLAGVVMLMKASTTYAEFKRALNRAAPKQVPVDATDEDVEAR